MRRTPRHATAVAASLEVPTPGTVRRTAYATPALQTTLQTPATTTRPNDTTLFFSPITTEQSVRMTPAQHALQSTATPATTRALNATTAWATPSLLLASPHHQQQYLNENKNQNSVVDSPQVENTSMIRRMVTLITQTIKDVSLSSTPLAVLLCVLSLIFGVIASFNMVMFFRDSCSSDLNGRSINLPVSFFTNCSHSFYSCHH